MKTSAIKIVTVISIEIQIMIRTNSIGREKGKEFLIKLEAIIEQEKILHTSSSFHNLLINAADQNPDPIRKI